MIEADKPMKRSFFSKAATLLLHRRENWRPVNGLFYYMHSRLEIHSCCTPQASLKPI